MKIRSVYIQNLNSLQLSTKVDFCQPPLSDAGLFAITGDTGAGKTTILDAMTLALYGSLARGKEVKEVMSYGSTESVAEVEFEAKDGLYRAKWTIWRARGKTDGNVLGPKRELSKYNEETEAFEITTSKIKETDEAVEAACGLDYDRFRRSVLLAQGEFAAFLNADERERSELLERITGTAVYSELSIAAFQRHKREREQLEKIHADLGRLDILDDEGQAHLQNELARLEEQTHKAQQEATHYRAALARWENRNRLAISQKKLEQERQELAQQQERFQADQERLQLHQKLAPVANELDRWKQLTNSRQQLQIQMQADEQQMLALQKSRTEKKAHFAKQQAAEAVFAKELAAKRMLLEQTRLLDSRIADLQANLLEPEAGLQEDNQSLVKAKEDQQNQHKQLHNWQQERQAIQQQLKESAQDAQLAAQMGVLEKEFQDWQQLQADLQKGDKEIAETAQAIVQAESIQRKLQKERDQKKEKAVQLQEDFRKELPQEWSLERDQLIDRIMDDLQDLRTRKTNLEQLYRLAEEYQKRLLEYDQSNEHLAELSIENEEMDKAVLNLLERRDQIEVQVTYRRKIYLQQQTIANYAKDRQDLAEGEACPLCFSTDHPFREHDIEPFVDEAKIEFEATEKEAKQIQKQLVAYLSNQRELLSMMSDLQGKQMGELGGKLARLNEEMEQIELQIAKLSGDAKELAGGRPGLNLLAKAIEETQEKINRFDLNRKKLQRLTKDIEEGNQQIVQLEQALIKATANLDYQKEKRKNIQTNRNERAKKQDQIAETLSGKLKQWGIKSDPNKIVAQIEQLQKRSQLYQDRLEQQQSLKPQIAGLENRLAAQEKAIQVLESRIAQQTDKLAKQQKHLQALQTERKDSFGEADTNTVSQELLKQEQAWKEQLESEREHLHRLDRELTSLEKLQEEKQSRQKEQEAQQNALEQQLQTLVQELGFSDLVSMGQARLSNDVAQQLEARERDWQKRKAEIERLANEIEKEWASLATYEDEAAELLQEQLQATEALLQQSNQEVGAIRVKLLQQEEKRKQAKALLKKIKAQEKETTRWAKLDEIIGQADGKKFRSYAQGLTLRKLIALANRHLQKLNGRYLIHKKPEADLELEIVDIYQADNHRPMQTLSGGESFLVSLALALGLSDLAGRNTQIRSLFIDEGFGSLDENSLDLAITTLENLQADGKTIGVISHVKALKERISTQIKVIKSAGGRSRLELV